MPKLLASPNMIALIRRYVIDLNLPLEIVDFIESDAMAMKSIHQYLSQNSKGSKYFELYALSMIIVVLRALFLLDGISEVALADAIRCMDKESFVWSDWESYAFVRMSVVRQHFFPLFGISADEMCDIDAFECFNHSFRKPQKIAKKRYLAHLDLDEREEACEIIRSMQTRNSKYSQFIDMTKNFLSEATDFAAASLSLCQHADLLSTLNEDYRKKSILYTLPGGEFSYHYNPIDLENAQNRTIKLSRPLRLILIFSSWMINVYPFNFYRTISRIERDLFSPHVIHAKKVRLYKADQASIG